MGNRLLTTLVAVGRFIRSAWLLVGLTLGVFLFMEFGYRAQRAIREKINNRPPLPNAIRDPEAGEPWFDEFTREYDATRPQRWKSYVYWGRRPNFHGRYVNIDSAGHRVTPQPTTPATPAARVFFFGGSTMWGTAQRDSFTIAAEAARRLQTLTPGSRVDVTNFGESGYVSTQELLELMLALRAGQRPDVVVFYDGINDVGTTVQFSTPGLPQNETKRVAEFDLGRAIDRSGFDRGLGHDTRAIARLTGQALRQLALVEWAERVKSRPAPKFQSAVLSAIGTAQIYVENMRIVDALAVKYGFIPIYVWQPSIHATDKIPTPYEKRILRQIAADSFNHRQQEVHRLMPAILDSAMRTAVAPGRFVDASRVFAGDSLPVFVDWIGHNTETSVPKIVDAFWPSLQRSVETAIAAHRRATP